MGSIKVRNGTIQGGDKPLCFSCKHGCVFTDTHGRTRAYCGEMGIFLQSIIKECTRYDDKKDVSKWDFETLAWILETGKNKGSFGFQPPKNTEE